MELKIVGTPKEIGDTGLCKFIVCNYDKFMFRASYVEDDKTFTVPLVLNEKRYNQIFNDKSVTTIILELIPHK